MELVLQLIANGLMLGGLFAIVSIGLTLIFGIVRVVNFAHGEFLMVGMYLVYYLTKLSGLHPYVTAPIVIPVLFVLGAATQRFIIQPLLAAKNNDIQIFATVGLSTAMINLALLLCGADLATTPAVGLRDPVSIGPISVLSGQLVILVGSALLTIALHLFLNSTRTGRAIRATAQNRVAARLMGVNVNQIYILTFGLGAACVGVAAVLIAPLYPTSPTIGTSFVLTAFVVVVLGGLGSIGGAFVGAMAIGLIDSFSSFYLGQDLQEVIVFSVFLLVLLLRPAGLFSSSAKLSHVSP